MLSAIAAVALLAPMELRVFHVGNSVTDTIRYPALAQMVGARGDRYTFGRHMIPGAPLEWLWNHRSDGFTEAAFGGPDRALREFRWDVLTLQPFDRKLDSDLDFAQRYIDLAKGKSPNLRVLVYSRWPRRNEDGTLDYAAKWSRKYTGGWDGTEESRDYFLQVLAGLRKQNPTLRVDLVPVGDVIGELDREAAAGRVPGLKSAVNLFVDGIHFGDLGAFTVGTTFAAVLFQKSPVGLSSAPYGVLPKPTTDEIQRIVWRVVTSTPETGVKAK